jgi:nucleotidyltransferase/DNA polymerase involved in DNA repair
MRSFLGIDGDRVGAQLEALIVTGDLRGAATLSENVGRAVEEIKQAVVSFGGTVIFAGADSILAETSAPADRKQCRHLGRIFFEITGCTASVGIGRTPVEAYLALKLAKARRGGAITDYADHFESSR